MPSKPLHPLVVTTSNEGLEFCLSDDATATYKTTRLDAPTNEELYFALQGSSAAWYVRESR